MRKIEVEWFEPGMFFMMEISDNNIAQYESMGEEDADIVCGICDYYWDKWDHSKNVNNKLNDMELERKVFEWTRKAALVNPHDYSYRMGFCYAFGIDCDREKGFRLARKYWEDAFDFGEWRAADGIADLYEERLNSLPDIPKNWDTRINCKKHAESWRKLARKWERMADTKALR